MPENSEATIAHVTVPIMMLLDVLEKAQPPSTWRFLTTNSWRTAPWSLVKLWKHEKNYNTFYKKTTLYVNWKPIRINEKDWLNYEKGSTYSVVGFLLLRGVARGVHREQGVCSCALRIAKKKVQGNFDFTGKLWFGLAKVPLWFRIATRKWKTFRQINYLVVISKMENSSGQKNGWRVVLIGENRLNFCKWTNDFLRGKSAFSRQINVFTKAVTQESISRHFLSVISFYSTFPHSVLLPQCGNYGNSLSRIFAKKSWN